MSGRQAAQPGHAEERGESFWSFSISLALSYAPESSSSSFSAVSNSLSFSSVLPFSCSPLLSLLNFHMLKSNFFFTSEELFVLQGQVHGTLEKLNSHPDSLQHSGGGSVCYKTLRRVCRGWLKLSLLLCFAELLSFTLLLLLFLLSSWWFFLIFFLLVFFKKEQLGPADKKGL